MSLILKNKIKPKIPIVLKKTVIEKNLDKVKICGICYQPYKDTHLSKYELNLCFHDICYQCSSQVAEVVNVDPEGVCAIILYKCPFCRLCSYGYCAPETDEKDAIYRWGCLSEDRYFQLSHRWGIERFIKELTEKKRKCDQCSIDFEPDFDHQRDCSNCLI